ncbi:MAG: LD-carboxypeptidase [Cyanobacteria bacterium SIG31]|nr:LD-carboxypeptidase [Cyanobacteria bacterium SIG31]
MIKQGDTIGIIALGGNCEQSLVEKAIQNIEALGFKVKISENIYNQERYLAGSDESKLKALYEFFQDPEIKLILNARGGYGSVRLINKINYEIIKSNPKPFCGFSDITALLLMFYKKCGLMTYHGPMASSDFAQLSGFTQNAFFKAINDEHLEYTGTKTYIEGGAEGILWGGNLSTVVSLCGQDFIPDGDFIFFAEDLNEPVYKIDKMFTQLFNIGKFSKHCKGIVLGDFLNVDNGEWLEELFYSFMLPTVGGFKITHEKEKITLPIGKLATIKNGVLKV